MTPDELVNFNGDLSIFQPIINSNILAMDISGNEIDATNNGNALQVAENNDIEIEANVEGNVDDLNYDYEAEMSDNQYSDNSQENERYEELDDDDPYGYEDRSEYTEWCYDERHRCYRIWHPESQKFVCESSDDDRSR